MHATDTDEPEPLDMADQTALEDGVYRARRPRTAPASVPFHQLHWSDTGRLPFSLTPLQARMLRLAAMGMTSAHIALLVGSGQDTVQSRLSHAYRNLGARDRAHACVLAVKHGLVDLDDIADKTADISRETWQLRPSNVQLLCALFPFAYIREPLSPTGQDEIVGLRLIGRRGATAMHVWFGDTLVVLPSERFEVRRGPTRAAAEQATAS